jgi:endoglucanase
VGDEHIIVTFHYYQPMLFTHQGASWAGPENEQARNVRWTGTPDQLAAINTTFDAAQAWSKANNRPLFLGEFGTYAKFNTNMDDRVAWTRAVSKAAADRGIARALWVYEGSGGFGIHDAGKGWVDPLKNALVNP